ncbi:hypothetical protein [Streptomyces regalis]|uniref:hypothetical protein n=1 Tax=Streptomyces regalis TaxID=68262 RepID=UPI000A680160|nr:hypothetical protein [Streptomyces regalis]
MPTPEHSLALLRYGKAAAAARGRFIPVCLVLDGLVRRQYAAYYSHAVLVPVRTPAPDWALDAESVRLYVPNV